MKVKTRRYYIYYLFKFIYILLSFIPLRVTLYIGEGLGRLGFLLVRKYRNVALGNLNSVFSQDRKKNLSITKKVFINMAKNGVEWIKLSSLPVNELDRVVTEFEGEQNLKDVLSKGKGAVVLGFHFGNWELLGLYLKHKGYNGKLVARRLYFYKYDKLLVRMRARFGAKVIYRDESPRKMLKELFKGNILGIVPDQDVDSIDGVFVDFFGKAAYTPVAPVKIAMAAKTSIVPIFVVRKQDNTHKIVVEKPIDLSGSDQADGAIKKCTQEWTSLLEQYVRKYPEQWVWVHSRWKTQPSEVRN